jgi:hypothetical protein
MSWRTFHHRGEILRAVVDAANDRRDGVLPMDVPGAQENFADELDLIGALLLKWHARLSGNIERTLSRQPTDLESAVATAWRLTAEQMPGVRLVLDRSLVHPVGAEMERAMSRARQREWSNLATAAGLASSHGVAAAAVGRRVEESARQSLASTLEPVGERVPGPAAEPAEVVPAPSITPSTPSFVDRIKAVLAA